MSLHLAVPQLGLGLPLKLGLLQLEANYAGEPLPDVFTPDGIFSVFDEVVVGRVIIDCPGQGGLQAA